MRWFVLILALLPLLAAFQNCGTGATGQGAQAGRFDLLSGVDEQTPTNSMPTVLPAPTVLSGDSLIDNCLFNVLVDACIFAKNPVAQTGQAIATNVPWYDALLIPQRFGVRLKDLDASGYLQNDSVIVLGAGGDIGGLNRLTKSPTKAWRQPVNIETNPDEKGSAATQIAAYYWFSSFINFLESSPFIDSTYVKGSAITTYPYVKVVDGAPFQNAAYISGGTKPNTIAIGFAKNNSPLAFAAEVIIHEFTHGMVYHASGGVANQLAAATHRYCLDNLSGTLSGNTIQNAGICCKSANGCMLALNEGLADYFASTMFPDNPTIGESFVNSPNGLTTCQAGSPRRDVRENAARTPASVFNICQRNVRMPDGSVIPVTATGEAYTMASVYTSILWEIRKNMKTAIPKITVRGQDVDGAKLAEAIVYDHMMSLNGQSTFSSSRIALKSSAVAIVSALAVQLPTSVSLAKIIDDEFARRGVQ